MTRLKQTLGALLMFAAVILLAALAARQSKAQTITPVPRCTSVKAYHTLPIASPTVNGELWLCRDEAGFSSYCYVGNPAEFSTDTVKAILAEFIRGGFAGAWAAAPHRDQTAEENQICAERAAGALLDGWIPRVGVTASTATDKARAVQLLQPDGRLLTYKVGLVSQRILGGTQCARWNQIANTAYFSVAGQTSITGNLLPTGTYAECTVAALPP